MSDQQPPPEHTQRYLPGAYQPEGEESANDSDTVRVRKRLNTPPAVPPQPGFAPTPPGPPGTNSVPPVSAPPVSAPPMPSPQGLPQAALSQNALSQNAQSQQIAPAGMVPSPPPAPHRAPAAPLPQPITGPVTRSSTTSARQRGGLSDMPPIPPRDPAEAVMEHPQVPEHKRFCSACGKPVGRPQAGRGGRVEGYCAHCRTRYWFTPALQPGDVLSERYEVLGAIAHGGLGWIYLANDQNFADDLTQRWVVIKGLINTSDEDAIEAAINERRFLVGIDHPNVVDIHDFVTAADPRSGQLQSYIVMEYLAGKSLRDIRDAVDENGERKPLPLEQVLTYTAELLPAFSYLHDRGLLFCDFKPDNMIHVETWLKLIDLGAVRHVDDMESAIYGTPGYSVPNDEILSVGPSVTSDLYTIGRSMAVLALDFKGFTSTYRDKLPAGDRGAAVRRLRGLPPAAAARHPRRPALALPGRRRDAHPGARRPPRGPVGPEGRTAVRALDAVQRRAGRLRRTRRRLRRARRRRPLRRGARTAHADGRPRRPHGRVHGDPPGHRRHRDPHRTQFRARAEPRGPAAPRAHPRQRRRPAPGRRRARPVRAA